MDPLLESCILSPNWANLEAHKRHEKTLPIGKASFYSGTQRATCCHLDKIMAPGLELDYGGETSNLNEMTPPSSLHFFLSFGGLRPNSEMKIQLLQILWLSHDIRLMRETFLYSGRGLAVPSLLTAVSGYWELSVGQNLKLPFPLNSPHLLLPL